MRRIVLDTETTGLAKSDRIIEIAAMKLGQGSGSTSMGSASHFHHYVNPHHKVHPEAFKVHGISDKFLADKPEFSTIADEFLEYIQDSVLIIHNAAFDLYYLNFELALHCQRSGAKFTKVEDICAKVEDSLLIAQNKFPGQHNSLDALLVRFGIDASSRDQGHGALIDVKLLGKVYESLCLTQSALGLNDSDSRSIGARGKDEIKKKIRELGELPVIKPSEEELLAEEQLLKQLVDQKITTDS